MAFLVDVQQAWVHNYLLPYCRRHFDCYVKHPVDSVVILMPCTTELTPQPFACTVQL
jgi:hypothetical protein